MELWKWAVEIGVMVVFYILTHVAEHFFEKEERFILGTVLVVIACVTFSIYVSFVRNGQL